MEQNPIYKFLKENNLTQKSEQEFIAEYADKRKSDQLAKFLQDNGLTEKTSDELYYTYFIPKDEKAKVDAVINKPAQQSVPTPTEDPNKKKVDAKPLEKPLKPTSTKKFGEPEWQVQNDPLKLNTDITTLVQPKEKPNIIKPENFKTPDPNLIQDAEYEFARRETAIDENFMKQSEEFAVPKLNYLFEDYGFKFEEFGLGNQVKAIAPSGETITFKTNAFTQSEYEREKKKIEDFIAKNRPGQEILIQNIPKTKAERKIVREDLDVELPAIELQENLKQLDMDVKAATQGLEALNNEAVVEMDELVKVLTKKVQKGELSQEKAQEQINAKLDFFKKREEGLKVFEQDIQKRMQGFSGDKAALDQAFEKYADMKKTQTNLRQSMRRSFEKGALETSAGLWTMPSFVYDLAAEGYNTLLRNMDENLGTNIGTVPTWQELKEGGAILPGEAQAQLLRERKSQLDEIDTKYSGSVAEMIENGEYGLASQGIVTSITESLPFMLAVVGTQGVAAEANLTKAAATFAEFGTITAMSAANRMNELNEDEQNLYTQRQKLTNATVYGMSEALATMLGEGLFAKTIGNIAKKEGMSAASKFAATTLENLAVKVPFISALSEPVEEIATQVLQNAADKYVLGKDVDLGDGTIDAGIVALAMGSGFATVEMAARYSANSEQRKLDKQNKEVLRNIGILATNGKRYEQVMERLDQMAELGEITREEATQRKKNITNSIAAYNSMPEDLSEKQKIEAFGLIEEKRALEEKIEGKDAALVAVEKERIEAINNQLTEISKNKKEETTDAVQEQETREVSMGEQTRDSEGVEQEVPEQTESGEESEELATTEAEVTATNVVEALKDVESTTKAIDSLPDRDINMLSNIKNRRWEEAHDKELRGRDRGVNALPVDEYNKKFIELQSKYDGDLSIGEAYHKAKKDGSNPELVAAVEELLAPKEVTATEQAVETPTIETKDAIIDAKKAEIEKIESKRKVDLELRLSDLKAIELKYGVKGYPAAFEAINAKYDEELKALETTQPIEQKDETKTETIESQPMLEVAQDGGDKGQVGQESPELRTKEEVETTEQVEQQEAAETDRLLSGEAIERRQKGSFKKDGIEYKRQQPKERPKGKKGKVRFTDKVEPTFTYTLIEAEELQPSHMQGRRNANHFLPEAQPKPRTDLGSKEAEQKIASNPKLELVGEDVGAYSGAPIVNNRGEVIQGNNRASGLVQHAKNGGTLYKQQLEANAEQFGFTKEQVQGMKNPILVREVNANDEVAIELGNYDVKDLETGGSRPIDPIATSRRIPIAEKQKITDVLFQDETLTLNQSIRANYDKLRGFLSPYINQAQRQTLFASETPSAKNIAQIEDLVRQFLFDGGDPQLGEVFEGLTLSQQAVINRALPSVFSTNRDNSLISELQNAIVAANSFASANTSGNFQQWTNQADMFNEGRTPKDVYTPIELAIAEKIANVKNQSDPSLKRLFDEYSAMVKGKPADLISPEVKPISKQDAITKTINKQEKEQPSVNERTEKAVGEKKRTDAKAKEIEKAQQAFADKLRGLKIDTKGKTFDATLGLPVAVYNTAVEIVARSVEGGMKLANAIAKAMKYIDSKTEGKKWNKGLFAKEMNVRYSVTLSDGRNVEVEKDTTKETAEVINGWYQPIEQKILDTKQYSQPANKWAEQLRSKEDEDLWTGVRDFLQNKGTETVSKRELIDFIRNNRVEIVEVVKGEKEKPKAYKRLDEIIETLNSRGYNIKVDDYGTMDMTVNGMDDGKLYLDTGRYYNTREALLRDGYEVKETYEEDVKLLEEAKKIANQQSILQEKQDTLSNTKFAQYQLEGEKENYKEVLVTLPKKYDSKYNFNEVQIKEEGNFWSFFDKDGELITSYSKRINPTKEDATSTFKQNFRVERGGNFKSSHFEEPNIVVHLRMNTRTDVDGNKVLFLEEIQSDWGQQGKKEGFGGGKYTNEDSKRAKELNDKFDKEGLSQTEMTELTNLKRKEKGIILTPSAPFVMDTNAWTKLGLKVALKEAVKQGIKSIAWTTGEQQNDRYDLSKQVEYIQYEDGFGNTRYVDISHKKGITTLYVDKTTGKITEEKNQPLNSVGQNLEDVVGKDLAEKILADKKAGRLEGDGLKVGGKGMKGFYGSPSEGSLGIVGNVAKSLFKQEVGTTKIGDTIQYSIDITSKLKASVSAGLPLFGTELAKAELAAAKKAFNDKLRGGFQSGGLNALPEFIKLVKAYAKLGITTATDFVAKFKQDFANSTISDTELTEAFESVKEGSSKIISAENKSNAIIEKLKSDAANLAEVKKELREYINSVLQDEKLAKGYSRRDIDKIMGLISKVTPSNIDKIKAEVPAKVSDMVAKIQALKAQQRQEVTDRLNKLKDKAANNSAARKMLTEFIRDNMPNAAVYSKSFADALINLTQKVTDKTIAKALQTVLDKIEGKRQKLKKKVLNEMYSFASKKAKAKKDLGGKRVATTVLADDRLFFREVSKILEAYLKNDTAKMQEYRDSVSDANIIAQINAKDQSGITLSSTEAMLLGRSMTFDVLGDLDGMTLEETEQVETDIKERYKEARQKFLDKRKEITDTIKEIHAEARKQIEVVAPFLYGTTPSGRKVLKGINQRNAERKSILAAMKKLGIVNSIKDYLTKLEATYIGKKSYNLIKAVATMENLIEKLDRVNEGRQFFRKNIYNVLSRANSERIENRERHNLILRALIKRNFKTKAKNINPLDYIRKQLRGEPIEVAGLINPLTEEVYTASFSMDEMLAIVTWSFNQDNVELLEKQGINQAVIDMFKAKLGDNLVNFAFDVTQYLSTSVYEKVNEVYRNLNNVMLAKIENYFPRVSVSNAIKDNVLDANNFGTMLSAQTETFIKERTPGSIEIEIVNNGFTDLLEDHLDGVARYTAYAEPARKLNYVFNSPDVNAYLEETGVKSLLKSQVQYAINPESLRDSKLDNWAISWIQSALTAKVLGFKLAQVQKQASSFVYFAPMYKTFADKKVPLLDTTAFLGEYLYAMKNPKEVFEYMWKLSPEFRDRVREGLKGNITTLESGIRNKDSFFKLTTRNDKVGDVVRAYKAAQASPTVVGDLLGVSGYYPILKQMERRGATREELQLAASEFNTMQQTKRDMDKTAAQQNPNIATTMLFMFGSQQILMLNKASIHGRNIMRSIAKREAPKLYDMEMLYFSLAVVNASFVAAGYIYKLFGDEEDREEYFEELKDAMKLKAFLFWIPILGQNIKKAMARLEGKPYRDAGYGVDPLSDVWRKAEDQLKRGKTPLYVFSRGFSEMITRTDFEPFIGFADQVVGEGHPAVNIYKMLGVSKSYRPHIYDPYYDKTLPKELKELMKESPDEFESEYGFGGFSYPDYAERDRMIRDVVMEVKKDMRAMNATEEEIEEAVSNVKERIREAERKRKEAAKK